MFASTNNDPTAKWVLGPIPAVGIGRWALRSVCRLGNNASGASWIRWRSVCSWDGSSWATKEIAKLLLHFQPSLKRSAKTKASPTIELEDFCSTCRPRPAARWKPCRWLDVNVQPLRSRQGWIEGTLYPLRRFHQGMITRRIFSAVEHRNKRILFCSEQHGLAASCRLQTKLRHFLLLFRKRVDSLWSIQKTTQKRTKKWCSNSWVSNSCCFSTSANYFSNVSSSYPTAWPSHKMQWSDWSVGDVCQRLKCCYHALRFGSGKWSLFDFGFIAFVSLFSKNMTFTEPCVLNGSDCTSKYNCRKNPVSRRQELVRMKSTWFWKNIH